MTTKVEAEVKDKSTEAYEVIHELYQMIDETFLVYFISLAAPRAWRPHLANFEKNYRNDLKKEGRGEIEIERRLGEQDHVFFVEEFRVQTTTKNIREILEPGSFENLQAKNTVKIVYDSWESTYRPRLQKLVEEEIQSEIWGELGWIRQSITHRDSKGTDKLKKAKLITDFAPGQQIILTHAIMEKIKQELENWYTEFSMKYFSSEKKSEKGSVLI
ncbi:MAG: hypothetical protein WC222_01530 [Parachlamydiales bacterium]